jgi:hypothetical protein
MRSYRYPALGSISTPTTRGGEQRHRPRRDAGAPCHAPSPSAAATTVGAHGRGRVGVLLDGQAATAIEWISLTHRGVHTAYLHLFVATYEALLNAKPITVDVIRPMCFGDPSWPASLTESQLMMPCYRFNRRLSAWADEQLFMLLNARYLAERATLLSRIAELAQIL